MPAELESTILSIMILSALFKIVCDKKWGINGIFIVRAYIQYFFEYNLFPRYRDNTNNPI